MAMKYQKLAASARSNEAKRKWHGGINGVSAAMAWRRGAERNNGVIEASAMAKNQAMKIWRNEMKTWQ
jgi:hypothetical protein